MRRDTLVKMSARIKTAALLFVIVAGFYWKLTLTSQYNWMWSPDMALQVLPWFEAQARQWHHFSFPLWDQYLHAGQPLLGQAQPGAAYPLNWLLFWMPLHDGHIRTFFLNWYYVAIHLMAAAFAYLFCRDLGRSRTASLIGGLTFSLAAYIGAIDWPQMLNGAVWIPLVFLFLLRAGAEKRMVANAALSGMFLGIAWLSGHHQVPMFTSLAFVGTWIFFIFRSGKFDRRMAKGAVIALVFVGLCGAAQILPAYEYGHLAKRWAGAPDGLTWKEPVPYYVHEKYDLKAWSLFGLVFPGVRDGIDPFVGTVALALAALALTAGWRDPRIRLLFFVGTGALVYSLGHQSVFQGFLYGILPEIDKARAPGVAIALVGFAIAPLAAFGFDRWLSPEPSPWNHRIMLGVLGFGALTFIFCEFALFTNRLSFPLDDRVLLTAAICFAMAGLMYAFTKGNLNAKQAGALVVLLLLFELGNSGAATVFAQRDDGNRNRSMMTTTGNEDIAAFLRSQPGIQRTAVSDEIFQPNWGEYHDVQMWAGYLASITLNMVSFEAHRPQAFQLFGVAYQIAPAPTAYANQEVFAGASGLKVYKQPLAFPRAWAVHQMLRLKNINEGNWMMMERTGDLHNTAFMLQQPPQLTPCQAADDVKLLEDRGSRVNISAILGCPGMVVLSDAYFPGWLAYVDDKPTPIYEVNLAMRGILVPAGRHYLKFRYRPLPVYLGAALSLAGILGAVLLGRVKQ
jgi:hypothetical protein